jgi:heme/copper-type cytochrome/quinol oxidase subunit 2
MVCSRYQPTSGLNASRALGPFLKPEDQSEYLVADLLSELHLPHWLIVAGVALVVIGALGIVVRRLRTRSKANSNED